MTELFPVNAGNVPPPATNTTPPFQPLPTQSTVALSSSGASGPGMRRRKRKDPSRPPQKLKLERILGLTTASSNILATAESQDLIAYAAGAVVVLYNHKRNKQVGFLYPPTNIHNSSSNNNNPNTNAALVAAAAHSQTSGVAAVAASSMMLAGSSFMTPMGSSPAELSGTNAAEKKKKTPASTRAKPISCLAFSPDGNYLAAGEMGHQPRILIWDVKARMLLHECRGHKFGVLSLAFSPNMRYLVSIGFQHDGYLYVWNWKKGIKLAGNKVTSKVNALSFSKDGTYFVTAGLRHVKFWYFDARGRVPKRGNLSSRETQVLDGRSGILGALRESNFVAVGCDRGKTENVYFLTDSGILCMFKEGRVIDKWVDLQVQSAYSIAVSSNYVICACAGGIIRLFEPESLKYCGMLPKPHPLGTDIGAITSPEILKHYTTDEKNTYYPDVIAITYDESSKKVTAVYADRSLFLWDIRDLKKVGKYRSFVFHSDCVWGVEPCPNPVEPVNNIPCNSFATHSADGTIRIWNLDNSLHPNSTTSSTFMISSPRSSTTGSPSPLSPSSLKSPTTPTSSSTASPNIPMSPSSSCSVSLYRRNIYSRELVKMLYVDNDAAEFSKLRRDVDFTDDQYPDFGIRSIKMSSDGKLLATGDRNGNLRVHSMETWDQITYQEAHDSEILAMDLTHPSQKDTPYMIATASRDRLLHVFDINSGFQLVQTLDDHSSSITAVKFSRNAKRLISCGADKGVIFRNIAKPPIDMMLENDDDYYCYSTYHNYSGRGTVFDMSLDLNDRYIATVTGERRLYVFNTDSGKPVRVCKPETAEETVNGTSAENSGGSLINIDLDPYSGTYAVTSGSDRSLRLFDLTNSACIEKVSAHAELITSVKFIRTAADTIRVISTCSDGTIFLWKLSDDIVCKMKSRCVQKDPRAQEMVMNIRTADEIAVDDNTTTITATNNNNNKRLFQKTGVMFAPSALAAGNGNSAQANNNNTKMRLRRVSTATAVRPTPSLSQMVRQGERRTFSTMSPAESKYDDLYKKISMRRSRPQLTDHLSPPENVNNSPASPISKSNAEKKMATTTADNNRKRESSGNSGRKTPDGKLERLYNGIPTSGVRDRTGNHGVNTANRFSNGTGGSSNISSGEASPRSGGTSYNSMRQGSGLNNPGRMNPVLRRHLSREAMNNKQPQSPTASNKERTATIRPGVIRRKRSSNLNEQRRASLGPPSPPPPSLDSPVDNKSIAAGLATIAKSATDDEADLRQQRRQSSESIHHRRSQPHDDDDDGQEAGDERDINDDEDEEDDEEEEEEEEEVIFLTSSPEQDNIGTPFEVTSHDDIHDNDSGGTSANEQIDDHVQKISDDENINRKTPEKHRSGGEDNSTSTADDDEDGSTSEDNADDVILQAITSREAPRMTPSLSRTSSMTSRRLDEEQQYSIDNNNESRAAIDKHSNNTLSATDSNNIDNTVSSHSQFTPSSKETSNNGGSISPGGRDTPALRELQKKLEKAKKRQSFTARYLSSLGDRKGTHSHQRRNPQVIPSFYREELGNALENIRNLGNAETTIPIVAPKIDTSAATLDHIISNHTNDRSTVSEVATPTDEKTKKDDVVELSKFDNDHDNDNNDNDIQPNNAQRQSTVVISNEVQQLDDEDDDDGDGIKLLSPTFSPAEQVGAEENKASTLTEKVASADTSSSTYEHVLSDLDGAIILLDSVLDTYISVKNNATVNENQAEFITSVDSKMGHIVEKISQAQSSPPLTNGSTSSNELSSVLSSSSLDKTKIITSTTEHDPATIALLDKYSTMLMQIVEKKLLSSSSA